MGYGFEIRLAHALLQFPPNLFFHFLPCAPLCRVFLECYGTKRMCCWDSVRPIWPSDKCEEMVQLITELGAAGGAGERLQRELVRRARHLRMQSSWIEAWWEKEHLLKSRLPLPVFGNWYGLDRPDTPCMSQSLRAAWLSLGAVRFHRHLSREKLEPLRMMSVVPLCMNQYKGVFNTCRIPCKNVDELHTWDCPSPFGPSTVPQVRVCVCVCVFACERE